MKRNWLLALFLGLWLGLLAGCQTPTAPPTAPPATPPPNTPTSPAPAGTSRPTSTPPATPSPPPTVSPQATAAPPTDMPTATATPTAVPPLVLAVIGDYGLAGPAEAEVAALVRSWSPALIITLGDNNYPAGAAETLDDNVGQYYHDYIAPYSGRYGPGAESNRFFPVLGNHDWLAEGAQPYLDYFTLPGRERYYDFVWGPIHFFALDSDYNEPDGIGRSSVQATWLQTELAASTAPWKLVYAHHAPYSSGYHGSYAPLQWPFAAWGASAVLAGHDHTYERLLIDGIPYFVNGLGGGSIYAFVLPRPESQARYNRNHGAMRLTATSTTLLFEFITTSGETVDSFVITRDS